MADFFKFGDGVRVRKGPLALKKLVDDIKRLAGVEVLVGFPEDTTERNDEDQGITNAALGYIHDTGMPEQNIPARPFMLPGITEVKDPLTAKLREVAVAAANGRDPATVEKGLHQVGLIAKLGIQNKINEGIPPPLADSTLRARAARGRKGAANELANRAKGEAPGMASAKPLVDTGQMRNAVNYVIRARNRRT